MGRARRGLSQDRGHGAAGGTALRCSNGGWNGHAGAQACQGCNARQNTCLSLLSSSSLSFLLLFPPTNLQSSVASHEVFVYMLHMTYSAQALGLVKFISRCACLPLPSSLSLSFVLLSSCLHRPVWPNDGNTVISGIARSVCLCCLGPRVLKHLVRRVVRAVPPAASSPQVLMQPLQRKRKEAEATSSTAAGGGGGGGAYVAGPSPPTTTTAFTERGGKWRRYTMAIADAVLRGDRQEAKRLAQLASMP